MPTGNGQGNGGRTFTNVPARQPVVVVPPSGRGAAPHVATGEYGNRVMPLTPREREARRIERQAAHQNRMGAFGIDPVGGATQAMSKERRASSRRSSRLTSWSCRSRFVKSAKSIDIFYNPDPLVGQSIDLHTELPLSKVRLAAPRPLTCPKGFDSADSYGKYILWFFENWAKKARLFHHLITAVHHYWLDGSIFIFAEDSTVDVPQEVGYDKQQIGTRSYVDDNGDPKEEAEYGWVEKSDRDEQELAYYQKHYKGWDKLIILPIDQVKVTTYSFTDKVRIE